MRIIKRFYFHHSTIHHASPTTIGWHQQLLLVITGRGTAVCALVAPCNRHQSEILLVSPFPRQPTISMRKYLPWFPLFLSCLWFPMLNQTIFSFINLYLFTGTFLAKTFSYFQQVAEFVAITFYKNWSFYGIYKNVFIILTFGLYNIVVPIKIILELFI